MPQDKKNAVQVKEEPVVNSETKKDMPETKQGEKRKSGKSADGKTGEAVALRSLTMDDLRQAKDQVSCC